MNREGLFCTSNSSNEIETKLFTYADMLWFHYRESRKIPGIKYSRIYVCKESEYKKIFRTSDRWVILQIFCDAAGNQLMDPQNRQDGFGRIVYADAFDESFSRFMNGRREAIFEPSKAEVERLDNRYSRSKKTVIDKFIERLGESLSASIYQATTPEFTITHVKNYRKKQDSSVVLAKMDFIMKAGAHNRQMFADMGYRNDDYVIAEYNELTDKIVQSDFINPDLKVKNLIESNNGIVIIEN